MARILKEFCGKYTIRHGEGSFGIVERGFDLYIGTGEYGDLPPDGVRVGLAIVNPATGARVLPTEGSPSILAYLVDGTLNGSSYHLEGKELPQLLGYQISLQVFHTSNGIQKLATITITIGDPQNAGVWGAEDSSG